MTNPGLLAPHRLLAALSAAFVLLGTHRLVDAAEPNPVLWHLVLPNHYDIERSYPCIAILAPPQTSMVEVLDLGHGFFHQAGRAGLIVAVPIPQVVSADEQPIRHFSRRALQLLKSQPAVDPDHVSIIAFDTLGTRALELAMEHPDLWPKVALVHPPFTILPPSPAWENLHNSNILIIHPDDSGDRLSWIRQCQALMPDETHIRSMVATAENPWSALSQLAAEMIKFSVGEREPESNRIHFASLRHRSNRMQWIGDIVRDDPALPAKIEAEFNAETGFHLQTENAAALTLHPPANMERPYGVRWLANIDDQVLDLDPSQVWWRLRRRPSGPWSTAPDRSRTADGLGPARRTPTIGRTAVESAVRAWAATQDLPEGASLALEYPPDFLNPLPALSPSLTADQALEDQWLDALEGLSLNLHAPNDAAAPAPWIAKLNPICEWRLIGSGSAGPQLWPLLTSSPPSITVSTGTVSTETINAEIPINPYDPVRR